MIVALGGHLCRYAIGKGFVVTEFGYCVWRWGSTYGWGCANGTFSSERVILYLETPIHMRCVTWSMFDIREDGIVTDLNVILT